MATLSSIGKLAQAETRKEFADQLARYTSLSAGEAQELFPKQSDQEELLELLKIVTATTDDNSKKAKLIERIGNVSGAVIKIAKRFAAGF